MSAHVHMNTRMYPGVPGRVLDGACALWVPRLLCPTPHSHALILTWECMLVCVPSTPSVLRESTVNAHGHECV